MQNTQTQETRRYNRIPLFVATWRAGEIKLVSKAVIQRESEKAVLVEQLVKLCPEGAAQEQAARNILEKVRYNYGGVDMDELTVRRSEWLPLSQIERSEDGRSLTLTDWMLTEKALFYAPEAR